MHDMSIIKTVLKVKWCSIRYLVMFQIDKADKDYEPGKTFEPFQFFMGQWLISYGLPSF